MMATVTIKVSDCRLGHHPSKLQQRSKLPQHLQVLVWDLEALGWEMLGHGLVNITFLLLDTQLQKPIDLGDFTFSTKKKILTNLHEKYLFLNNEHNLPHDHPS